MCFSTDSFFHQDDHVICVIFLLTLRSSNIPFCDKVSLSPFDSLYFHLTLQGGLQSAEQKIGPTISPSFTVNLSYLFNFSLVRKWVVLGQCEKMLNNRNRIKNFNSWITNKLGSQHILDNHLIKYDRITILQDYLP